MFLLVYPKCCHLSIMSDAGVVGIALKIIKYLSCTQYLGTSFVYVTSFTDPTVLPKNTACLYTFHCVIKKA